MAVADDEIDAFSAVELVWSLLAKSLLVQDPAGGGTRYRMLMTVRTFARRYLESSADLAHTATRTARHYLSTLGPQITKIDPAFTSNRARELDNLRSLLADVAAHHPACAQELAYTILDEVRGINAMEALAVGRRYVEQLSEPTPELVGLLVRVGFIALDDGKQVDLAAELLERAEALATTCPAPQWLDGRIDQLRSLLLTTRGEFAAAASGRRRGDAPRDHGVGTCAAAQRRWHGGSRTGRLPRGDHRVRSLCRVRTRGWCARQRVHRPRQSGGGGAS